MPRISWPWVVGMDRRSELRGAGLMNLPDGVMYGHKGPTRTAWKFRAQHRALNPFSRNTVSIVFRSYSESVIITHPEKVRKSAETPLKNAVMSVPHGIDCIVYVF